MAIEISNGVIRYIEPNDLQGSVGGRFYENIPFKTEDLCIAVDIVVEVPSRYKEATGNGDNHMWINDTKQTISFLGGTNGMLTTSFTDISGYGSKGEGNRETLGIKSIKIEYNSYYFPTVNVVFTDVRGSSLMEAQEEGYVDSLVNRDKIMTQGSFFRALFKFPYPVFHMKVKGFYGKPVEYDLVVSKFNTSFDSNSGNFDVEVEFIGHMYGVYGDLPFKYIMYAPYIQYPDSEGNSYWNNQVKAGVYCFDDGKEMIPFFELKNRILTAQSSRTSGLEGTVKQYRLEIKEVDEIKEILASYDALINSFGTLKYQNKHLGNGEEGRYILILEKNDDDTAKRNATIYRQFCTKLKTYKETWHRENILPTFDENAGWTRSVCYTIDTDSEREFNYDKLILNTKDNPIIKNSPGIQKEFSEVNNKYIIRDIFGNLRNQLWTDASSNSGTQVYHAEIKGFFFDTQDFLTKMKGIMDGLNATAAATKRRMIEAEYQNLVDIVGFAPTAKNIVKLLFAHIDCFMHKMHSCINLINNPRNGKQRTFNTIGFNVTNTDVRRNVGANTFVPPFPLTIDDRNKTVYPGTLPGIKTEEMPELDLVESLLTAIQSRSRSLDSSVENKFVKNLLSDIFVDSNVYKAMDNNSSDAWADIVVAFANRLFNKFALEKCSIDTDTLKNFAYTEAFNVFQNIDTDRAMLDTMTFSVNKAITYLTGDTAYLSAKNPRFMYSTDNAYVYDWMIRDRDGRRNSMILTDYANMREASKIYKNKLIDDKRKIYPLTNDITELFETYQCVFDVRADMGGVKMLQESATNMEGMKKYFRASTGEYDSVSKRDGIFKNIVDISNDSNGGVALMAPFTVWYKDTFVRQNGEPISASTDYSNFLTGTNITDVLKTLNFDGNNLFKNKFYFNQGVEGRALLFLQSLPFKKKETLEKFPFENHIVEVPYILVLFMGGVLYYLNQGFVFNDLDAYKIPLVPVFCTDSNETLKLLKKDDSNDYTLSNETIKNKLLGLKWPVQYKLMSIFLDFVRKDFIEIDNWLSLGIKSDEYANFEEFVKNLIAYKKQMAEAGIDNIKPYAERDGNNDIRVIRYKYEVQEQNNNGQLETVEKEGVDYFWSYNNTDVLNEINERSGEEIHTREEHAEWKKSIKAITFNSYNSFQNDLKTWIGDTGKTVPTANIIRYVFGNFNKNVELTTTGEGDNFAVDWQYNANIGFVLNILKQTSWVYMLGNSHMDANIPIKKYYIFDSKPNKLLANGNIGDMYSIINYVMVEAEQGNKIYGPWGSYEVEGDTTVKSGRETNLKKVVDGANITISEDGKAISIVTPGWIRYIDGNQTKLIYAYASGSALNVVFNEKYDNTSYEEGGTENAVLPSVYCSKLTPEKCGSLADKIKTSLFIKNTKDLDTVIKDLNNTEASDFSYDRGVAFNQIEARFRSMAMDIAATKEAREKYKEASELLQKYNDSTAHTEAELEEINKHPYIISGDTVDVEKIENERLQRLALVGKEYSSFEFMSGDSLNPYTEMYMGTNGFIVESLEHNFNASGSSVNASGSSVTIQGQLILSASTVQNALTYFVEALAKYKKFVTDNRIRGTFSDDMLESTYLLVKSLYDRWICGIPGGEAFWSLDKRVNKGVGEYSRFKFIDSYYNDISDELYVNLNELKAELDKCSLAGDYSPSVYVFLANVNEKCKCLLIPSPAFGAVTTETDFEDLFRPLPYSVMASKKSSGPAYLWIYPGNPSTVYDGDSEYEPDSFDIADSTGRNFAPTMPEKLFDHTLEGAVIPAFGVSIGAQNQGFVKNISLSTTKFEQTEYSIKNSIAIADTYGKQPQAVNYMSQDLYRVYANYSYTVTAELMGNVSISPMMYFQLNNVPMFKGVYYVIKVSHNIGPGTMTTSITGVRISKNKVPMVSEVLNVSDVIDITIADPNDVLNQAEEYIPMTLYREMNVYTSSLPAAKNGNDYSIDDLTTIMQFGEYETEVIGNATTLVTNSEISLGIDSIKELETNEGVRQTILKDLYEIGIVAKRIGYNVTLIEKFYNEGTKLLSLGLTAAANNEYKTGCNNELYDMICCLYCNSTDDYIASIDLYDKGVIITFNLQTDANGSIPVTRKKYYAIYEGDNLNNLVEFYKSEWLRDADSYGNTINDYLRKAPTYVGTMAYLASKVATGSINSTLYKFARIEGYEKAGMMNLLIKDHVADILR